MEPLFKNDPLSKRLEKAIEIKKSLIKLNIHDGICPELKEFSLILNNWVKEGKSQNGKIILPEINRKLIYNLNNPKYTVVKLSVI